MKINFIITVLSYNTFRSELNVGNQDSMVKSCTAAFLSLAENK